MKDSITVFSTVKLPVLRKFLLLGTLSAGTGVIILTLAGMYIPPDYMVYWGTPILLVAGTLIAKGLIPYRKLSRMETKPDELLLVQDEYIQYMQNGNQIYTIPLKMIEKLDYIEKGDNYGIGVYLKKAGDEKIIVHDRKFPMEQYQNQSRTKYGCDLFIPYFSRRAFMKISF